MNIHISQLLLYAMCSNISMCMIIYHRHDHRFENAKYARLLKPEVVQVTTVSEWGKVMSFFHLILRLIAPSHFISPLVSCSLRRCSFALISCSPTKCLTKLRLSPNFFDSMRTVHVTRALFAFALAERRGLETLNFFFFGAGTATRSLFFFAAFLL